MAETALENWKRKRASLAKRTMCSPPPNGIPEVNWAQPKRPVTRPSHRVLNCWVSKPVSTRVRTTSNTSTPTPTSHARDWARHGCAAVASIAIRPTVMANGRQSTRPTPSETAICSWSITPTRLSPRTVCATRLLRPVTLPR